MTGEKTTGNRGGMMNRNMIQDARNPLARFGRRVAAIVAECNYATTRMASLRDTPARF